ncbi:type VI secretion system-associated protein TagO [Bradyrhizobium sp. HKCCYLRH2060]|uniref:type VI secretion system-associated protein TagO n=1 Tax=Bradyrhizobium sp. HKCCYLRH2060 TaxID=3420743 RepID=UPI003EB839AF
MARTARPAAWLSAIVLATIPSGALAQAEILMIGLCKKIADDTARLKCYDAIPGPSSEPTTPKAEAPPVKQEWKTLESKSPIDDSPQFAAALLSEDGRSRLVIRCAEHKTEAYIEPNGLFAWKRGSVLIRVNDLPAVSATWPASSDNKALFAPNGTSFIKMLPEDGTLFIRATGHSNRADDATFKLGQVSLVRDRLGAACSWSEARPAPIAPPSKPKAKQAPAAAPPKDPMSLAPK